MPRVKNDIEKMRRAFQELQIRLQIRQQEENRVDLYEYENGMVLPYRMWFIIEGDNIRTPVGPFPTAQEAHSVYQAVNATMTRPNAPYLSTPRIEEFARPITGIVPHLELQHVGYMHEDGHFVSVEQWEAGLVPEALDGPHWQDIYIKAEPKPEEPLPDLSGGYSGG